VINGQDVVLLKLAGHGEDWTVRSLEAELGMSRAGVHRSLQRLSGSGLYDLERRRANISQAEEFLVHAVKYLFPPELGGETRGVPTVWAAPPSSHRKATCRPCGPTPTDASAASHSLPFTPACPPSPSATPTSASASR